MFDALQSSLSAVRAHTRGVLVSAHNIANSVTPDFHPQEAIMRSAPGGGVIADVQTRQDVTGVDLTEETVNMIAHEAAIKANIAAFRASDKTLGVLLDIVG